MTIGKVARKIFGKKFSTVGLFYRSIFVNLHKVADSISSHIPQGAMVIDIGGGDGQMLNHLLSMREDIIVEMIDINTSVGGALKKDYLNRVKLYPATNINEYTLASSRSFSLVFLISDVIHHIPEEIRKEFFYDLRKIFCKEKEVTLIIKDVEPGYFRSFLGHFADCYISGDKNVSLVGRKKITFLLDEIFGDSVKIKETDLFKSDKPNYALICNYQKA